MVVIINNILVSNNNDMGSAISELRSNNTPEENAFEAVNGSDHFSDNKNFHDDSGCKYGSTQLMQHGVIPFTKKKCDFVEVAVAILGGPVISSLKYQMMAGKSK